MLKIAICDIDIKNVEKIYICLEELAQYYKTEIHIDVYYRNETLLRKLEEGYYYHLIFLEISLEGLNPKKLWNLIRKRETNILIIYITNTKKSELFYDFSILEPFRILKKPFAKELYIQAIKEAYERIKKINKNFSFKIYNTIYTIPLNEIIYFKSDNRIIHITAINQRLHYYDKLDNVEEIVNQDKCLFLRIHKSYLINYNYIKSFSNNEIILTNDETVTISEKYLKTARLAYYQLLGAERYTKPSFNKNSLDFNKPRP